MRRNGRHVDEYLGGLLVLIGKWLQGDVCLGVMINRLTEQGAKWLIVKDVNMKREEDEKGPKINANVGVALLRQERNRLAVKQQPAFGAELREKQAAQMRKAILEFSRDIVEGLDDDQIVALSEGRAVLEGVTPGPITYKELSDD